MSLTIGFKGDEELDGDGIEGILIVGKLVTGLVAVLDTALDAALDAALEVAQICSVRIF